MSADVARGGVAIRCRAVLFDLDGVLVDSRACVERVWRDWARLKGLDPAPFLAIAHGRRTSETLQLLAPALDVATEVSLLDRMEEAETRGLRPIPGASELLRILPADRWAIVTSGHRAVAFLRLTTTGHPLPDLMVTGEEVHRGKPDPEGYLIAAQWLDVEPAECLVLEDSPPGIEAALAAGAQVLAVSTTHPREALSAAQACVPDLRDIDLEWGDGHAAVRLRPRR